MAHYHCDKHAETDLTCKDCVETLPKLTDYEKLSLSSLGDDFIPRLFMADAIARDIVDGKLDDVESIVRCVMKHWREVTQPERMTVTGVIGTDITGHTWLHAFDGRFLITEESIVNAWAKMLQQDARTPMQDRELHGTLCRASIVDGNACELVYLVDGKAVPER